MPKSISGPVGKGGKNRSGDVLTVQYLLNCVPKSNGGPAKELILDGLCGMLTEAAIVQFQRASLGFADGRVDTKGPTITKLLSYDPYPSMQLTLPTVDSSGKGNGKRGGNPMSNCWDPFSYYNPSHENYMKGGYEPPPFEGKHDSASSFAGGVFETVGKFFSNLQPGYEGGAKWPGSGASGASSSAGKNQYGKQGEYGKQGGKSGPEQPGMKGSGAWPGNPTQPITTIGGDPMTGKTGSSPQSNTKGSQSQGGIVGKV